MQALMSAERSAMSDPILVAPEKASPSGSYRTGLRCPAQYMKCRLRLCMEKSLQLQGTPMCLGYLCRQPVLV